MLTREKRISFWCHFPLFFFFNFLHLSVWSTQFQSSAFDLACLKKWKNMLNPILCCLRNSKTQGLFCLSKPRFQKKAWQFPLIRWTYRRLCWALSAKLFFFLFQLLFFLFKENLFFFPFGSITQVVKMGNTAQEGPSVFLNLSVQKGDVLFWKTLHNELYWIFLQYSKH